MNMKSEPLLYVLVQWMKSKGWTPNPKENDDNDNVVIIIIFKVDQI